MLMRCTCWSKVLYELCQAAFQGPQATLLLCLTAAWSFAQALARLVTANDLAAGCIYPDVRNLRSISLQVARAVAQKVRRLSWYDARESVKVHC